MMALKMPFAKDRHCYQWTSIPYLIKVVKTLFWWSFTENYHCHQQTSRSPVYVQRCELWKLFSGGDIEKGCPLRRLPLSTVNKQTFPICSQLWKLFTGAGADKGCPLKSVAVNSEQADLLPAQELWKLFSCSGSNKGFPLTTTAANSEKADLPYLLTVVKTLFWW